jgi:hypothetical protein
MGRIARTGDLMNRSPAQLFDDPGPFGRIYDQPDISLPCGSAGSACKFAALRVRTHSSSNPGEKRNLTQFSAAGISGLTGPNPWLAVGDSAGFAWK